ncbi:MAG TPA: hybrid sensor histidine kinase/response regulator, partial [Brevundimonas sp.]|nr:hybrid sensor histidine kinase/response regulator [Brevundimonas sp.]
MVESDGVAKTFPGDRRAGDPAQALTAILQTQYLRYVIIASWALALLGTAPWWQALIWFVMTLGAGTIRGVVEHKLHDRVEAGWGMVFPAVATVTTAAWAVAPLMAWYSG